MTKPEAQYQSGQFQFSFLSLKYWGIWFTAFILMFLAYLPWAIQWRLAKLFSKIAWTLLGSRRKTTLRNLGACFPEKHLSKLRPRLSRFYRYDDWYI